METRNRTIPAKVGGKYYAVRIKEDRYCVRLRIFIRCEKVNNQVMRNTCNDILTYELNTIDECIEKACRIIRNRSAYHTKTPIRRRLVGKRAIHQNH